jgi:hypothetical protein
MSVRRAQEEISSSEFSEWLRFLASEPSSDQKRSYEAASICLTIARANGNKNVHLEDFLLKYDTAETRTKKVGPNELKAKLFSWLGVERRKRGK